MDMKLTIEDAYDVAHHYIEKYYDLTQSDDAGSLLSGMLLVGDHGLVDAAMWQDWFEALHFIKPDETLDVEHTQLTAEEAYFAMTKFLQIYCDLGVEDSFIELVASLKNKTCTLLTWQDWLNSVEEVMSHTPRIRPYLELGPK